MPEILTTLSTLGLSPKTIIDLFTKVKDGIREKSQDERINKAYELITDLYNQDDAHTRFEEAQSKCNQQFRKEIDELKTQSGEGYIRMLHAREVFKETTLPLVQNTLSDSFCSPLFGSLKDAVIANNEDVDNILSEVRIAYPEIEKKESYLKYKEYVNNVLKKDDVGEEITKEDFRHLHNLLLAILHDIKIVCGLIIDCGTFD